ncbi:MAG: acyltransferase family protein [Lachnospiraceae bacterium]
MPAFVFISGYFSKKKASLRKLFGSIAIPYFTYEILYYLLYLLLDKETGLYFARPKFSLWYLMALFFWRLLSPVILKIPGHMVLMTVAGLLIGCSELDNFLSIPRILYFFPFFLAGLHFDSSLLYRLRTPGKRLISLGLLGGYLVFLFTDNFHRSLTPWIFYGRYSYHDMGLSAPEGAAIRLLCYAFSFLLLFLLLAGTAGFSFQVFRPGGADAGHLYLPWVRLQCSPLRNRTSGQRPRPSGKPVSSGLLRGAGMDIIPARVQPDHRKDRSPSGILPVLQCSRTVMLLSSLRSGRI